MIPQEAASLEVAISYSQINRLSKSWCVATDSAHVNDIHGPLAAVTMAQSIQDQVMLYSTRQ